MKFFQNFVKMNFPCSFKWDLITHFSEKNPILSKKRVPKTKNGPLFGEKCKFKVPNFHSVGIHVQKTLHLRETGGLIPPSPPPGVHVGFKPW